MQAVVLVGGEGTRLRPLTSWRPKPVITLVDRPFLVYMLEWLAGHGVDDVILSCGFEPTKVRETLGDGAAHGVRLRYVVEPEPRGTAGALKEAEAWLEERFLMLNGDVLTDVDVSAQVALHERSGAVGTLGLVPVEDPSAYGLVLRRRGRRCDPPRRARHTGPCRRDAPAARIPPVAESPGPDATRPLPGSGATGPWGCELRLASATPRNTACRRPRTSTRRNGL
jgi:UTP-glucose-1-phosphate uridylyltransferase